MALFGISIMTYLGGAMIAAMIISPGVQSQINMDKIRENIDSAQKNYDDLKTKWQQVFTAEGKFDEKLKQDIVDTFNSMNDSIRKSNANHSLFKEKNQQIQYVGIMVIVFVFFLLIAKQYDLFQLFSKV